MDIPEHNSSQSVIVIIILLKIISFITLLILLILSVGIYKHIKSTIIISLVVVVEIVFSTIPIFMPLLSHQMFNWTFYFGRTINEIGYRDYKYKTWNEHPDIKKILVIGDSFTHGNGIKNINKRYDKILEKKLNKESPYYYSIRIAAFPGWTITNQLEALKKYPIKPEVVIYQYYINDLLEFSESKTENHSQMSVNIPWWGKITSTGNFIAFTRPEKIISFDSNKNIQTKPTKDMCKEFLSFTDSLIQYCQKENIELYVLLIPELKSIPNQVDEFYDVFKNYLLQNNIKVVDPFTHLNTIPLKRRVVNRFDLHAGDFTHKILAEMLYENFSNYEKH